MDKDGKYYACTKIVNYKLSFDKFIDNCGNIIEQEDYKNIKDAKSVANQIVKSTGLSCAILKKTKYKSAINGQIKGEDFEIVSAIVGRHEKFQNIKLAKS